MNWWIVAGFFALAWIMSPDADDDEWPSVTTTWQWVARLAVFCAVPALLLGRGFA